MSKCKVTSELYHTFKWTFSAPFYSMKFTYFICLSPWWDSPSTDQNHRFKDYSWVLKDKIKFTHEWLQHFKIYSWILLCVYCSCTQSQPKNYLQDVSRHVEEHKCHCTLSHDWAPAYYAYLLYFWAVLKNVVYYVQYYAHIYCNYATVHILLMTMLV